MALETIFDADIRTFLESNLARAVFDGDHWTFLHIPKTAGSSFRDEIANVKQPDYNIEVDYQMLRPSEGDEDYLEKKALAIKHYVSNYFYKTRFVSGHISYCDLVRHPQFGNSKLISMIREPLARLRSDYLHQTSPNHPPWTAVLERYPTFLDFVHDPRNHNTMFNYLCRDTDESLEVTLDFLLKRYTWIGIQELYTFSIKVLFLLFGMRITPSIKEREGDPKRLALTDLTPAQTREVEEMNYLDYGIFRFFLNHYMALRQESFALSDYDRFFKIMNGVEQT